MQLLQAHRARESITAQCAVNAEPLSAGQWVTDPAGRNYQIQKVEHFRGSTRISARSSLAFDPTIASTASPGRNVATPDLEFGETQVAIIDLPIFDTIDPGKTVVGIFANGTGSGWRRAALAVQQGDSLLDLGATALPAIIGHSMNALPPHSPHFLDVGHSLDVQLAHDEIAIGQLPAEGVYCWAGGEFIRFGFAIPIAAGRYRLAELQRGCFGTEAAIHSHQAGEPFVWLEQSTARLLDGVTLTPGSALTIEATGFGDDIPVSATISLTGKAIVPLSPVHAHGQLRMDGGISLTWIRRSRIDFGWNDGVDQGLAEDAEQYLVSLSGGDGPLADWTVQSSELSLPSAIVAELNLAAGPVLTFQISQIGRHMTSSVVTVDVTIPL